MATISVDILNPGALNLLEELADLQLIAIRKDTNNRIYQMLEMFSIFVCKNKYK